jgi:hypothetical protein
LRKPRRAEPTPLHGLHAHTAANEALCSDPARHDQCPRAAPPAVGDSEI